MKPIILGLHTDGTEAKLNIAKLIEGKLMLTASTGGGKSWTIRKIVEEIYGKVQVVILDIEGEFRTLCRDLDFIYAFKGKDSKVSIDPSHASKLAIRVLETKADIIIDLYELPKHDRVLFVKNYLESMINAPMGLWHPVVVILDEAHEFAPEAGNAVSLDAVSAFASKGRKRQFSLIAATQRLSKLSKDVAAECRNKLVGLANMDIDRKRSAEELGFVGREEVLKLRDVESGEFYAVGPAFAKGVNHVKIGAVKSTHGHVTGKKAVSHKPTPNALKILSQFKDLPQEAAQEAKTIEEFKAEVRRLKTDIAKKSKQPIPPVSPVLAKEALEKEYKRGWGEAYLRIKKDLKDMKVPNWQILVESVKSMRKTAVIVENTLEKYFYDIKTGYEKLVDPKTAPLPKSAITVLTPKARETLEIAKAQPKGPVYAAPSGDFGNFSKCERAILSYLYLINNPGGNSYVQVAVGSGYTAGSGGLNNALGHLTSFDFTIRNNGKIYFNVDKRGEITFAPDSPHKLTDWLPKLSKCERMIFEKLLDDRDRVWSIEEIAEATGYTLGSGGLNNSLGHLGSMGLSVRPGKGTIQLNPELREFP